MEIESTYIDLASLIRKRRKELGLTQEVVAEWVGMSRANLVNIEQAKQRISLHLALMLAKFLSFDINDINQDGPTIEDLLDARRKQKITELKAEIVALEAEGVNRVAGG